MTILDERGRVGGRFNIIDAAAAIVVLVLIPAAVAAYLMFRTPAPVLVSISPATLLEGPGQRLEIDGANLRPFMRVTLGTTPAGSFLLGSTKYAIVDVPPLRAGKYDVVLYDYAREVARLPNALTIAPIATDAELEIDGTFKAPPDAFATDVKAGHTFLASGRTIATVVSTDGRRPADIRFRVGDETVVVPAASRDVAATLRVKCYTVSAPDGQAQCVVPAGDARIVVAPAALLPLNTPQGPVIFQIHRAHAPSDANAAQR